MFFLFLFNVLLFYLLFFHFSVSILIFNLLVFLAHQFQFSLLLFLIFLILFLLIQVLLFHQVFLVLFILCLFFLLFLVSLFCYLSFLVFFCSFNNSSNRSSCLSFIFVRLEIFFMCIKQKKMIFFLYKMCDLAKANKNCLISFV